MFKHSQLLVLSISVFLLMLGDGMVVALLPKTVISLTNSNLYVGYLAASYAVAQVMSQLPIGMLSDRWGPKLFILLGYVLSFIAGLLFYFTTDVNLIFWGRVLQGIAEAPLLSLAPALLSVRYSADKGKAIGIYNAAIYLGLTAGPLLRIMLLPRWSDHHIFLLYPILCLIGGIIICFSMRNQFERQSTVKKTLNLGSCLSRMKNPQALVVLWGITLYGAGFGIFMTSIPVFLLILKNYDQSYINLFFSLFYVAISLAQITIGWLSDRLGRLLFMSLGMLIAATGIAVSSYFDQFELIAILFLSGFGLGAYYLASMAFFNEKVPAGCKGAVSGIYYIFWGIGMFWGPLLLTGYIEVNSYQAGFQLFSVILLIQVVLLFITQPYQTQVANDMQ